MLPSRREEFAQLLTLEMGKPVAEARGEVAYGAEFLRWFAEEASTVVATVVVVARVFVQRRKISRRSVNTAT